jgi:hypothetical protein
LKKDGETNIVENMGVMLIIGVIIVVMVLALFVVGYFVSSNYKRYEMFRRRVWQAIFYNMLLRYILCSTLKLQIAALITITIAEWEDSSMQIMISGFILTVLTIMPGIFFYILHKNFPTLWKPSKKN